MLQTFRRRVLAVAFALIPFVSASPVLADDAKTFVATATGQIVELTPCGALMCQVARVSGKATRFGLLTGELHEAVDIVTGAYTGTAVFAFQNGDTISTEYVGHVISQDSGLTTFVEDHTIVAATGRLLGTNGHLDVLGTADAGGKLSITGDGAVFK